MRVPNFLPSVQGFRFPNDFPPSPVLEARLGPVRMPIGNAANGLCGGMAYAARDAFEAAHPAPPDTRPPAAGTPLFRYLVSRLFASFGLPLGPLRYLWWSVLPSRDRWPLRGVGRRTVDGQWPNVRADIERGVPSPLGLIRVRTFNPLEIGRNHQVLAYGYDLDEATGEAALLVYDPNHPGDDGIAMRFVAAEVRAGGAIGYVSGEPPVRAFFRTRYRPATPPLP